MTTNTDTLIQYSPPVTSTSYITLGLCLTANQLPHLTVLLTRPFVDLLVLLRKCELVIALLC